MTLGLFEVSNAALTCYSCSNCGTEWDVSKASIVTTSGPNDYCRVSAAVLKSSTIDLLYRRRKP